MCESQSELEDNLDLIGELVCGDPAAIQLLIAEPSCQPVNL
jgi:hypothetical protein